ncbi:LysM peptidoglycan-binding domain-containing protein [Knoellia sp. CPCC 206450]|uniref:LysM peptidoglycan-binding domain-containing protein n=1 Tax=Knoellia tibetensis TaxID=3404798 RepID=UPI003B429B35
MSAVAYDDTTAGYAVPLPTRRPERPRLVLVPTGEAVRRLPQPALRLTRAGRLAITTTVLLVALVAALAGLIGGASASGAPVTVTVEQGQTLSQIAAEHMSGTSLATAVAELQLANGLSSAQVRAGQTVVIPQG